LTSPFKVTVPPTLPGNLMKLTISHPSAKTITSISDDHSNPWITGATTTDSSNAETTEVRYVCGAATGTSVITVGFDQAIVTGDVVQFSYDEVSGIAASSCGDGSSGSSGGQGVLNPGVFTTTSGGDIVLTFGICASNNTEFGNQAGVAMPDDQSAKIAENDFDQFMSMVHVQASAGQISPTIYANAQDVNNNYQMYWNIVAQAFKASSGAGTEPGGIQVVTDLHFVNWDVFGWNSLPSNGNAVVFSSSNPSAGYAMGNLADNYGTTYTRTPYTYAAADPQQYSACLGANVSARDRIFSFTPDQSATHVEIYTIAGAKNANGTGCVGTTVNGYFGNQGSKSNANMVGDPVITPTINSGANSVIISTSYVGTGPSTGMCISGGIAPPTCTGQSAGVIFNSVYATGMTDGSAWYAGDPYVFFYTNSTSPRSIDYMMANGISATSYDGAAIEILGASGQVSQLVTPAVTAVPSASNITILQALSVTATVSGGSGNPTPTGTGSLTGGGYSSAATTLSGGSTNINIPAGSLAIGSNTLTVTYTPDANSSSTYNSATGTSPAVTVTQATPAVSTWPTASTIANGQTLASSTLTGGTASVSGAFAWTAPATVPPVGTTAETVTFTPTDATDYSTVAGQVSVTVNNSKSPAVSAWPTASAITYGQTLASSTLTGGTASVPGTFAWTAPATSPSAGTQSESVTFTPTDTTDYSAVIGQVSLTVNKATPTVSAWPTASAITYGQTLASSTLTGGTASVPGAFAWTSASTAPGAGTPSESVTFTPTNATNYTTVAHTVQLAVNKALLSVKATSASVPYNQAIPNLTYSTTGYVNGDNSSVLAGTPVETTTAAQGSPVGTYPITITQGTLAATNYGFQFVNGTLTITSSGTTAAPTATTRAASNVNRSSATLMGTVTANNATTQYWFAYGTRSTSLTSTTTATGALTGTSAKSVNATITGLRARTTYYFQVFASNAVGSTSGAVLSFTTR